MLRQIVSEVDHADTQRTAAHRAAFGGRDQVIPLIIQQRVKCANRQNRQLFQFIRLLIAPRLNADSVHSAISPFSSLTSFSFGQQGDFRAGVELAHWRDARIERAVGIAVVNVLNIDTTGRRTFLHHQREQLNGFTTLLADAVVLLVLGVQALKLVLIGEEGVIQARDVGRAEQGDIFTFQQSGYTSVC